MDKPEEKLFRNSVWEYYAAHGRHDLPWRQSEPNGSFDPYKILVSELMLQQTQVKRVIPKFHEFLSLFPDANALAHAPLGDVLQVWSGLGYNRRAKFLWQSAQMVITAFGGEFPANQTELTKLPGVGKNTAGAIMAYAFNVPVAFVETNIATVYIHHFFTDQTNISNFDILQLVEQTMDRAQPRVWYWALMDYGTHLKQTVGNKTRASKTYTKQSPFEGSKRQVRGKVLKLLAGGAKQTQQLIEALNDPRAEAVLHDLQQEGMITLEDDRYALA